MKLNLKKLNPAKRISAYVRDGISVIEVVTAMLVALIGVFGVLVLIPFSVQQAQIGLDQDAAGLLAENAIEDIKIMGLASVSPVIGQPNNITQMRFRGARVTVTAGGTPQNVSAAVVNSGSNLTIATPTIFHFDPIAVSNVGFPVATIAGNADCFNALSRNPDFLTGDLPMGDLPMGRNDLRIPVVTATSQFEFAPGGTPLFGRQEAERLFRNNDDLVLAVLESGETNALGSTISDVDIPQLIYDVNSTGNLVRTQTNGRISWSAIFVPEKPNGVRTQFFATPPTTPPTTLPTTRPNRFKVYVLVYRDRSVFPRDSMVMPEDDESRMVAGLVNRHSIGNASIDAVGGFFRSVERIPIDGDFTEVNKDEWVMLINRRPAPYYRDVHGVTTSIPGLVPGLQLSNDPGIGRRFAAEEAGYDTQVAFAKIRSVNGQTLYVEGGPFDFYFPEVAGMDYGITSAGEPDPDYTSDTYVVHLRNVITVYERTITLETNSAWN